MTAGKAILGLGVVGGLVAVLYFAGAIKAGMGK